MSRRFWLQPFGCILTMLVLPVAAIAHEVRLVQFEVFADPGGTATILRATLSPSENVAAPLGLPTGCSAMRRPEHESFQRNQRAFAIACDSSVEPEAAVRTAWGSDGALIRTGFASEQVRSELLPGRPAGAALPLTYFMQASERAGSAWTTLGSFVLLGAEHVLIGWDHLAFVLCLALLAGGWSIVWLITAFTVGHSISLALATFGFVHLPIAPVEAIIALSVVFVAREALLGRESEGSGLRSWQPLLVMGFGLLHGLGFASVLGDLTAGGSVDVLDLVGFNIGVEIGQLLFLAIIAAVRWAWRFVHSVRLLDRTALYVAGTLGLYWTVARVLSL